MKNVTVELTQAEALVLFEWLVRSDNAELLQIQDDAEQQVLWKIEATLEKTLIEPLAPNYSELLEAARRKVRDQS